MNNQNMAPTSSHPSQIFTWKQILYKQIKRALIGQISFTFMGVIAIIGEDTTWPWWLISLGMIFTLFCLAFYVYTSFRLRLAYITYFIYSTIPLLWIFPLFFAVCALISNIFIIALVVMSPIVIILIKYTITYKGLNYATAINRRSGLFDIKNGFWDISKPIRLSTNKAGPKRNWVTIAQIIAPIGPILGIVLYRSFPGEVLYIGIFMYIILINLIAPISGYEFAIGTYIKQMEKKIGRRIIIKD